MLRETQQDLSNEAEILDDFAKTFKCNWHKLGNGGKYRIDAVLYRDGEVAAWAEVKDYKKSLFLGLNVPKYLEGCNLAQETGKPFFLIFRHNTQIGFAKVHGGGAWSDCDAELKIAGGTQAGRKALPDDIEPMYMIDKNQVRWLDDY